MPDPESPTAEYLPNQNEGSIGINGIEHHNPYDLTIGGRKYRRMSSDSNAVQADTPLLPVL